MCLENVIFLSSPPPTTPLPHPLPAHVCVVKHICFHFNEECEMFLELDYSNIRCVDISFEVLYLCFSNFAVFYMVERISMDLASEIF